MNCQKKFNFKAHMNFFADSIFLHELNALFCSDQWIIKIELIKNSITTLLSCSYYSTTLHKIDEEFKKYFEFY